jgi:protein-S-isoprenylcysteine O-methyltransferase Ste14
MEIPLKPAFAGMVSGEFLGRLGIVAFFTPVAVSKARALYLLLAGSDVFDVWLDVLFNVTTLVFAMLIVVLTVRRHVPIARSRGVWPVLVGFLGSYSMMALAFINPGSPPAAVREAGIAITIAGIAASVFVLAVLGRSFSITAEARDLVTSGPYSVVRHPLYLTEGIASLGVAISVFRPAGFLIFFISLVFQFARMRLEEQVLRETFPAYDAYARSTPMVIPRLTAKSQP